MTKQTTMRRSSCCRPTRWPCGCTVAATSNRPLHHCAPLRPRPNLSMPSTENRSRCRTGLSPPSIPLLLSAIVPTQSLAPHACAAGPARSRIGSSCTREVGVPTTEQPMPGPSVPRSQGNASPCNRLFRCACTPRPSMRWPTAAEGIACDVSSDTGPAR